MTKNDLKKLRKSMPPKYRLSLSEKFKVSDKYIDFIFRGERNRPDIIDEAISMASKHKAYLKLQEEKIRAL